jgi:hypothetical protein
VSADFADNSKDNLVSADSADYIEKILSADYADYTDFKKLKTANNGVIYTFWPSNCSSSP